MFDPDSKSNSLSEINSLNENSFNASEVNDINKIVQNIKQVATEIELIPTFDSEIFASKKIEDVMNEYYFTDLNITQKGNFKPQFDGLNGHSYELIFLFCG